MAATGAADTREAFVEYLEQGLLTLNTPEIQRASVALYRLLSRGAPVTTHQLAAACGLSHDSTGRLLAEFPATSLVRNMHGAVTAFGGLSLSPTPHRFIAGRVELHTWCVLDALFLPEILGKPAKLLTHCPASGMEIAADLEPGSVRSARPSGIVMSILAPDRNACCANLRTAFCDRVNLFSDRRAFATWAQDRAGMGSVSLSEAQLLARQRNAARYPDIELAA